MKYFNLSTILSDIYFPKDKSLWKENCGLACFALKTRGGVYGFQELIQLIKLKITNPIFQAGIHYRISSENLDGTEGDLYITQVGLKFLESSENRIAMLEEIIKHYHSRSEGIVDEKGVPFDLPNEKIPPIEAAINAERIAFQAVES